MKTQKKKTQKAKELVANLCDKCYTHLKQALNHGLVLKYVHRAIKSNQEAWLKPFIDRNTKLKK